MLVEAWCPDCRKTHFLEVGIKIPDDLEIQNSEVIKQLVAENIIVKGVLSSSVVLANL